MQQIESILLNTKIKSNKNNNTNNNRTTKMIGDNNSSSSKSIFDPPRLINRLPNERNVDDVSFLSILERETERKRENFNRVLALIKFISIKFFFQNFFEKMLSDPEIDVLKNQEILLKALLIGVGILLFFVLGLIIYIVCTDSNNRIRFCCRRWFLASINCINNKKNNDDESNYVEMVSIT